MCIGVITEILKHSVVVDVAVAKLRMCVNGLIND